MPEQPRDRGWGTATPEVDEGQYACACAVYDDDPGMIVCWRCEQPLARVNVLGANVVGVLLRDRSLADDLATALRALLYDETDVPEVDATAALARYNDSRLGEPRD